MKTVAILWVLLFISAQILAQDQGSLTKTMDSKLYTNFTHYWEYQEYEKDEQNGTSRNEDIRIIKSFFFSPALAFYNKRGNSFEIEISHLSYSNTYNKTYLQLDSTGTILSVLSENYKKQFDLFLRYEYKIHLFKQKAWERWKPILGFSATPFIIWSRTESVLNTEFPVSTTRVGLYLSVIPRVEYHISKRWYLDLNFPLSIVSMHYTNYRNEDPSLEVEQKSRQVMDFYNSPFTFSVRLGMGLRF